MIPGDLCLWAGNELFTRPRININGVFKRDAGGLALIVGLDSYRAEDDDGLWFDQEMALVLVGDQLGWAPTNWLNVVQ